MCYSSKIVLKFHRKSHASLHQVFKHNHRLFLWKLQHFIETYRSYGTCILNILQTTGTYCNNSRMWETSCCLWSISYVTTRHESAVIHLYIERVEMEVNGCTVSYLPSSACWFVDSSGPVFADATPIPQQIMT